MSVYNIAQVVLWSFNVVKKVWNSRTPTNDVEFNLFIYSFLIIKSSERISEVDRRNILKIRISCPLSFYFTPSADSLNHIHSPCVVRRSIWTMGELKKSFIGNWHPLACAEEWKIFHLFSTFTIRMRNLNFRLHLDIWTVLLFTARTVHHLISLLLYVWPKS